MIPFDAQIGSYMRGQAQVDRPLGSGIADASIVDEMIAAIVTAKISVI